jgi:hypothetical protein
VKNFFKFIKIFQVPGLQGSPGKPGENGEIFVFEKVKLPCVKCPAGEPGPKGRQGVTG